MDGKAFLDNIYVSFKAIPMKIAKKFNNGDFSK
jgi:hypothetical protein